jgi:hypothetical protein
MVRTAVPPAAMASMRVFPPPTACVLVTLATEAKPPLFRLFTSSFTPLAASLP